MPHTARQVGPDLAVSRPGAGPRLRLVPHGPCPVSEIVARRNALTWVGQSSLRRRQRQWHRLRGLLVLTDGRLSQPFVPGGSPAAQVNRSRRPIFGETTAATDNIPGDRARFRETGQAGPNLDPVYRIYSITLSDTEGQERRSSARRAAVLPVLVLGQDGGPGTRERMFCYVAPAQSPGSAVCALRHHADVGRDRAEQLIGRLIPCVGLSLDPPRS